MKREPAIIIGAVITVLVFVASQFGVHVSAGEQQAVESNSVTIFTAIAALIPIVQSIVTRHFVSPMKEGQSQ